MKAGFAEIDFTPPRGFMPGHFDANYAIGAYTPLLANAAAFESDGETVILISADHLHFSNSYGGEIRQRIADATGVPFCNVMLASTHTHTGPAFDVASGKTPAEPNTAQVVAHRTVLAGIRAFENRKDGATLAIATTEEKRFSFCRDVVMADGTIRTNPKEGDVVRTCDTPDHTVEVMRVKQEGRTVAILVSFANHPDTNGRRGRTKYCADWPGYLRQALKEKYGEDVVVLFFNGCFGDLNHYDFVHKTHLSLHCAPDVNIPECIGRGLADTVAAALDRITETVADETVAVFENSLTVKLLTAYADMDAQPIQGQNIENSKREIEATLDTLNLAFEKLLDDLFADTALDVSSDITVLNTLLAQEGLKEDDLSRMKKRQS